MSGDASSQPAMRSVEYRISSNRAWFRFDWASLWNRRDLLFLFARRDLVSKYRQTVLGPLWHVLQPLALALVFSMVFGRFAGITTDGAPRVLFYLCSLLAWNEFSHIVSSSSTTFTSNADLFRKVYFPRLVVPLASLISNLVATGIQFGVFMLFYIAHRVFSESTNDSYGMSAAVVLLPLLVCQVAALALGIGLWISVLSAKYRDLKHAMSFLMLLWMFLTPVIYPLSKVTGLYRDVLLLNPVSAIVESFRIILLGVGTVPSGAVVWSVGITILALSSGVLVFQRAERTAVDTL